ncbi:MAG TPA: hypothetical protein GX391_03190 [Firmicutes bacterium]|nr:hypothetical protein [Bacillota bacterium]HOQ23790.1 cell wall hydrolase [Bacillota bacterium]HPT66934.1 cell wall hydrolase [Bacillota bacterium]
MIYDKYRNASRSVAGFIAACLIWNILGIFSLPSQAKPETVRTASARSRSEQATEKAKGQTSDGVSRPRQKREQPAAWAAAVRLKSEKTGIDASKAVTNPAKQVSSAQAAQVTATQTPAAQAAITQTKPAAALQTQAKAEPQVDLNLLARVIYAEARGEPFAGKVAVGAVLLNRLRNPNFPKSLEQIVFKKGEFCTVRDGQIWLTPDREAKRAAELAVKGWDPTNGALYFYNPTKTTSRWIWQRPVYNRIGNHVFAG